ncbi:MAG TPA: DUF6134 family protein [Dongiaceae bacterium]|nr:DUF6134 family protein [Dongiaceae bacterium]
MSQSPFAVNQVMRHPRRLVAGAATLMLAAGLAAPASAITAENAPSGAFIYQITRQGEVIGEQRLTFERQGDNLVVSTDAKIDVKLLGLSLYGFDQHTEETWSKNQLIGVSSTADDDGTPKKVDMELQGGQLAGDFNGKNRTAPLGVFPNSFWNEDSVKQNQILDTSRGKVRQVTVADKGTETLNLPFGAVKARHFSLSGEMRRELWYDDKGVLVAGELTARDGSTVRQELMRLPGN